MWTEFEYCYRDAGNFKAIGKLWFEGVLDPDQRAMIRARLESSEFFIAEQVRVPSLYRGLYQWSDGGSTSDDHCWHAFVGLREHMNLPPDESVSGSAREFAERFACVETWQEELSPHFSQSLRTRVIREY